MDHLHKILDELLERKLKEALEEIDRKKSLREKAKESIGDNESSRARAMQADKTPRVRASARNPRTKPQ